MLALSRTTQIDLIGYCWNYRDEKVAKNSTLTGARLAGKNLLVYSGSIWSKVS